MPAIPGLIYATHSDSLYINLYASNHAKVHLENQDIEVVQQTNYPWEGTVSITLNPEKKAEFTLKLRVPGWAQDQVIPGSLYAYTSNMNQPVQIFVNGQNEPATVNNGYIEIRRQWSRGDKVEMALPMTVRKVKASEAVLDDLNKIAFEYGPVVYCAETTDNPDLTSIRVSDKDSFTVSRKTILTDTVNVITGKSYGQGSEITLIPYYIWSNRGINSMMVWFPGK
ncbi:MAG: glycoside hydrolase family 127 protein [Bacteroidia bacterium]